VNTGALGVCEGEGTGCQINFDQTSACVENAPTCSEGASLECSETVAVLCFYGEQPPFMDCAAAGAACVEDAGCLVAPGDACVRGTQCGTSGEDVTDCPESGVCPG
jgi:hypothetical protein